MISLATSAAKSNGLYPRSSTSSANQRVSPSSTEPMEPPRLVDRSSQGARPQATAGRAYRVQVSNPDELGVRGDSCYAVDAGVEVWLGAVDGCLARSGWRWLSRGAQPGARPRGGP